MVKVVAADGSKDVLKEYNYDIWGNVLSETSHETKTFDNPFQYTGEIYDEESGLIYLRARYYDPSMGRFITEDSYEGRINNSLTLNLYVYTLNNPINRIDPSGHDSYVLYDSRDFSEQAESERIRLENLYDTPVHMIDIINEDEFEQAWNNMGSGHLTNAILQKYGDEITNNNSNISVYNYDFLDPFIWVYATPVQNYHTYLDVAGIVFDGADLINGILYTIEGDAVNASISYAALIPVAGWVATGSKIIKKAESSKVVNALSNFQSKKMIFGNNSFAIDKSGMKHILERHHPNYWNGTVKPQQSFFDESLSVDYITEAIQSVMKQNRNVLIDKGTTGQYQITGVVDGIEYVVGFKNGRVGQFYPKYKE
ncbi:RHS repeat-associated core domain-containing protein [Chengkuizengella marina]|uniref:RHS repeat-associated core domain-containing protein n=1 Tax=Chengkuizengella marina TaxID=2507566 RepID=UPI0013698001|nr:RHS repeat-associated core domain-containing protein [Chengkuizengella marina]